MGWGSARTQRARARRSIGVVGGKLALGGLGRSLGVAADSLRRGRRAGMDSPAAAYDAEGRQAVEAGLDRLCT